MVVKNGDLYALVKNNDSHNNKLLLMSKGENKRQAIFNVYKDHLNLLIDNGFVNRERDCYVCPICLRSHKNINSDDPLTLEDVPPKKMGGSAITLSCKSCNNTAGSQIDSHLIKRLREIDSGKLIPGTETDVEVKIESEKIQGKLSVAEDRTISLTHSKKNNHLEKLEKIIPKLIDGKEVYVEFLKSKVMSNNLEYALLKTGYLMMFHQFGYTLLFDKCFDVVRHQIKNPNLRVYPQGFWFLRPDPKPMPGIYIVREKGLESFVAMFNLNTGKTSKMFVTFLPLPIRPISEVIANFNLKRKNTNSKEIKIKFDLLDQANLKFLHDISRIKAIYDWIYKTKNS